MLFEIVNGCGPIKAGVRCRRPIIGGQSFILNQWNRTSRHRRVDWVIAHEMGGILRQRVYLLRYASLESRWRALNAHRHMP